ncbi:10548_t:CDS:1 [Scutellospora calospora]|uniref:10548_t:CDS:1 n=1 Tax=Scutellospora calospora TaxID=85575 RepID=A0ACA9LPD7_9GLOM|nr:10548_t:CDS:1 [Scutellospora calospora]
MSKNHTSIIFLVTLLLLYVPIYVFCTPLLNLQDSESKDSTILLLDHFISVSHKHPPRLPYPIPTPKPKRAYVKFTSPPDVTNGTIVFWETSKNKTLVAGQFSSGFSEGDEKEYTFKVYNETSEIIDLKPDDDTFDKLFKIRPNGSTDFFLFIFETPLVTGKNSVVGNYLVIGRPGSLLGKNIVESLEKCA